MDNFTQSNKITSTTSLQDLVEKLVDLNSPRVESSFVYGKEPELHRVKRKRLKLKIYNALFSRKLALKYSGKSPSWDWLSNKKWETKTVAEALAFRMRFGYRRYLEADLLIKKTEQLLEIENGKYESMVQVLFHLANVNKQNHEISKKQFLLRDDREQLSKVKGPVVYGDLPNYIHTNSYPIYPSWMFICDVNKPLMYSSLNLNTDPHHYNDDQILSSMKYKEGDVHGFHSNIFAMKNLSEDIKTNNQVEETLYGGLTHSKTTSMNITLSIPPLRNKPINLMQGLISQRSYPEEDEGFVSPGCENTSTIDQLSEDGFNDDSGFSYLLNDDQPYIGYRKPDYDVSIWRKCLDERRSYHRTWETWGQPAGVTKKKYYLTEAGAKVFDFVWKERNEIVFNLAKNLSLRGKGVAPIKQEFMEVDEIMLTHHSHLVIVGISSDTYAYNSLAHMFIASKNVYFSGVTPSSTRNLLNEFAEYGTCYLRLLQFSASGLGSTISMESNQQSKGVIFKAFCDGIRQYLNGYQRNALEQGEGQTSLGQLKYKFQQASSQIRYLCKLCYCGEPDSPLSNNSVSQNNFLTGISLLTYLYEEALYCTQSNDYLVLLYLLKKCCEPYLQFVQNWVFHGLCWDFTNEFMLKINDENFTRKDRRRWTNYIVASNPDDIQSSVPSFLAPVVNDLFICGKSRELLQHIDPEHFLCTGVTEVPELLLTFSKSQMKKLSSMWKYFETSMLELENTRTTNWEIKEEEVVEKKRKLAQNARKLFEEQLKEAQDEDMRIKTEIRKIKETELKRLQKQALDDIERKKLHQQQEKEEDRIRQEKLLEIEKRKAEKEQELLQEAKQEMISHYQKLTQEAEDRKIKADWFVKRQKLNEKRIRFLQTNHNQIFLPEDDSDTKIKPCFIKDPDDQPLESNFDKMLLDFTHPIILPKTEENKDNDLKSSGVDDVLKLIESEEAKKVQHVSQETISNLPHEKMTTTSQKSSELPKPHVSDQTIQQPEQKSTISLSSKSHVSDQSQPDDISVTKHTPGPPHVSDQSVEKPKVIKHVQTCQNHVSDQSKPVEPSYWQFPKDGPHISQQTTEVPQKVIQIDESQPHASKQSNEIEIKRASTKSVGDKHVSQSTIFDHVYENKTDNESLKILKSSDNIETKELINMDNNVEKVPELSTKSPILKVSSEDAIYTKQESMKAKALPLHKVTNINLLPHTSDSTIQDLMYTNMPEKLEKPKINYISEELKKEVTSHPSHSSIQLLMYPPSKDKFLYKDCQELEMKKFEIELLENDDYHNYIQDINYSLKSTRGVLDEPINLYKSVTEDVIMENENELETNLEHDDLVAIDLHALPILLRNCVIRPIRAQAALVNRCIINYFMVDIQLPRHFEMLRHFLLFEDGEFAQTLSNSLFEMIHGGCKPNEVLNPMSLDSIVSRAIQSSGQCDSNYSSNLTISVKHLPPAFSPSDLYVLNCIELKYHVDYPCNIILTESCHTKYNHVLAFLLQLKHVVWALHDIRARLTRIGKGISNISEMPPSQTKKLQLFRHEMHNFVRVMQGYVSTQVLHVCWQEFNETLRTKVFTLDDLHLKHAEYINKCVLRCLLTPKAQSIMNVICDVLKCILRFRTQLSTPASSNFDKLQRTYQEFVRFSSFLYRVVSKLVEKGYQPHLEDFLVRLNFNNYYKLSTKNQTFNK